MADPRNVQPGPSNNDPEAGDRLTPGPAAPGVGEGYDRDFGAAGRDQGADGSWGQGYGASDAPSDYRRDTGAAGGGFAGGDYARSFGGRGDDLLEDRDWTPRGQGDAVDDDRGPFAGRGPQGWRRGDPRLREAVCERLMDDHLLDARDIEVEAADGVVTLHGAVTRPSDLRLAEMIAREAPGVTEVRSDLVVGGARRYEGDARGAGPAHTSRLPR